MFTEIDAITGDVIVFAEQKSLLLSNETLDILEPLKHAVTASTVL